MVSRGNVSDLRNIVIAVVLTGGILAVVLFGIPDCVIPGCQEGSNERLEIINENQTDVRLHIFIERYKAPGSRDSQVIYNDSVPVGAGETTYLNILGENKYRLSISSADRAITFESRPVCSNARTVVIVNTDGELENKVHGCGP